MDMYDALNDTLERLLDDDVKNFQCKIETTLNNNTVKYIIRKNEKGEIEFEDCHDTKENDESKIEFEFKYNAITKGTYFIKDLNFYMDANVKTTKLGLYELPFSNIDTISLKLMLFFNK